MPAGEDNLDWMGRTSEELSTRRDQGLRSGENSRFVRKPPRRFRQPFHEWRRRSQQSRAPDCPAASTGSCNVCAQLPRKAIPASPCPRDPPPERCPPREPMATWRARSYSFERDLQSQPELARHAHGQQRTRRRSAINAPFVYEFLYTDQSMQRLRPEASKTMDDRFVAVELNKVANGQRSLSSTSVRRIPCTCSRARDDAAYLAQNIASQGASLHRLQNHRRRRAQVQNGECALNRQ